MRGFEEIQQDPGVVVAVGPARQGGFVTGLFGQVGEVAVEKPGERAEPEDGAMQKRQALGERVAAENVGEFMREDGVELGGVPVYASRRGEEWSGGARPW